MSSLSIGATVLCMIYFVQYFIMLGTQRICASTTTRWLRPQNPQRNDRNTSRKDSNQGSVFDVTRTTLEEWIHNLLTTRQLRHHDTPDPTVTLHIAYLHINRDTRNYHDWWGVLNCSEYSPQYWVNRVNPEIRNRTDRQTGCERRIEVRWQPQQSAYLYSWQPCPLQQSQTLGTLVE